jgi:glycosyltransferase involved in cell wall biosynthesis
VAAAAAPLLTVRALVVMPLATRKGGAEQMLEHLIEFRGEAGLRPTVAFLEAGPMVDRFRALGVPTVVVPAGRLRQARRFARTVRALRRLARTARSEVVISWMGKGQLYGGTAAWAAGLPGVWLQATTPDRSLLERLCQVPPAKLVVTLSRGSEAAQRALAPGRPTAMVYPGVDLERFAAERVGARADVRERLGLPREGLVLGSVGRFERWKGYAYLLESLPAILARHPEATFVLVGGPDVIDPAHAEELHRQADALGQGARVRLVGPQPDPEAWMRAMDVFVHCSQQEPFGIVVIEAMALGTPVVASAEGGPTEIVTPERDGLLAGYARPAEIAAQVNRLLDDPELRARLGAAGRERAQDFRAERFARGFGAAVAGALDGRP